MMRLVIGVVGGLTALAILGRYVERHDLDYCDAARRLRWLVFKEEWNRYRKRIYAERKNKTLH